MISILPSARTPWDLIGESIGHNVSQNLPGAIQQGFQRQTGLNAVDQLQAQLAQSGGSIEKMLPAIARAYTLNPNLERSGIAEYALRNARVNQVLGANQGGGNTPPSPTPFMGTGQQGEEQRIPGEAFNSLAGGQPSYGIVPRIQTVQEMDAQARDMATKAGDINAYPTFLSTLQAQNQQNMQQRERLERKAEEQGVSREDIPEFMEIGKNHNYERDEDKWLLKTNQDFGIYKNAKDSLDNAFIPGFFRGLVKSPKERERSLDRLNEPVQTLLRMNPALEPKIRAQLAGEYLSPTEVEERIHPLTEKTKESLSKLPKGTFPKEEVTSERGHPERKENVFVDYDTAVKQAPREMAVMNKRLVDFFKSNVNDDTSLLVLRDKLWDKDYDWRQISDALQEAVSNGLKLNTSQKAELVELQTQAPRQSLSDVFTDWLRPVEFVRGNK